MQNHQKESPKAASIWKTKADTGKFADTAPSKSESTRPSSSKKTTASSQKTTQQGRGKWNGSGAEKQRMGGMQYQAKLMIEEDEEKKTCLVKIGMRTSIRQVIGFSLEKIKKDWTVTFNAFSYDLTKALQACEIIKTRVPFLYQENKFISWEVPPKEKDESTATATEGAGAEEVKKEAPKKILRTGISIKLSKV